VCSIFLCRPDRLDRDRARRRRLLFPRTPGRRKAARISTAEALEGGSARWGLMIKAAQLREPSLA